MTDSYSGQSSVKTYIWAPCKVPDPENKTSGSHYKAVWQDLHYKIFLGNKFLLGCNHSLANSLLYYGLKCLG